MTTRHDVAFEQDENELGKVLLAVDEGAAGERAAQATGTVVVVEVDDAVVVLGVEFGELEGRAVVLYKAVDEGVALEELGGERLGDDMELGGRELGFEAAEERGSQNDIADGAETDEENFHDGRGVSVWFFSS